MHHIETGSGTPVVLVHGLGASLFTWRNTVKVISPNFTAYAVDLVGFGKSPAPSAFEYTVEAQAKAVAAFIVEKGLSKPYIVGHSMGGGVCVRLAAHSGAAGWPEIGKMILIAPFYAPLSLNFDISPMLVPGVSLEAPLASRKLAERFLKKGYSDELKITPEHIDGYAEGLSSPGQFQAFVRHFATLNSISFFPAMLDSLTSHSLIIWGENDPWLDTEYRKGLNSTPGASVETVPNCGHFPHEECAPHTNGLIANFLLS